jgi:inward rectifier potassium channel
MSTASIPPASLPPELREEQRDLGFGSVVSRQSRQRLLNKDGSFNVARTGLSFWKSLSAYHALLTMSWTKFFAIMSAAYVATNALFACFYMAAGPGTLQRTAGPAFSRFLEAFFFSVQTLSTVGYGETIPATVAANVIVSVEALLGLMAFALATGIVFARFSRPTAHIIFSRKAVITNYRDITALEFRIANARNSQLLGVEARVILTRFEERATGPARQYYNLPLERDNVAFFPLSWTVVHPIDEASPLHGVTCEELLRSSAELLVLLSGMDEIFAQTVHARSSYLATEIEWGRRFVNLFKQGPKGQVAIDVSRLHETEPGDQGFHDHNAHVTGGG